MLLTTAFFNLFLPSVPNKNTASTYHDQTQCKSDSGVYSLALSPDDNYVAAQWGADTAKLWDRKSGQLLHTFSVELDPDLSQVIFSPDSKRILTGSSNYAVLWDIRTGAKLQTFPPAGSNIEDYVRTYVAFTPDSKYVFTGGNKGATKWDAQTGAKVNVFPGTLANTGDQHIQISANGKYLLTHSDRWELWDIKTAHRLFSFPRTNTDVKNHWFLDESASFSPDSKLVLINARVGFSVWRTDNYQRVAVLDTEEAIRYWYFSPNSRYLATFSFNGGPLQETALWDLSTNQKLHVFHPGHNLVGPFAFTPDSKALWIGTDIDKDAEETTQIGVWDIAESKMSTIFILDQFGVEGESPFTHDGKYWLTTDAPGRLQMRETETAKRVTLYC